MKPLYAIAIALITIVNLDSICLGQAQAPSYTDPANTDQDFPFQGEYSGNITTNGIATRVGVQVIALGRGRFQAIQYRGGLPGDGWDGTPRQPWEQTGERIDDYTDPLTGKNSAVALFAKTDAGDVIIADGTMNLIDRRGTISGRLKRVQRISPSLGVPAPKNAIVLFDGTSIDGWKNGKLVDGLLQQGTTSKHLIGSCKLHLEFRLPYMPESKGQKRGNSGIYVQGRWEVQMLDSFGLTGEQNECGGIYSVAKPDLNMCFPPLSWQTYDIDFTSAKYDADGKLESNARISVWHNGEKIHSDVELPNRKTTAAPLDVGPEPGPVFLQNHGNPVRYRNIWLIEK